MLGSLGTRTMTYTNLPKAANSLPPSFVLKSDVGCLNLVLPWRSRLGFSCWICPLGELLLWPVWTFWEVGLRSLVAARGTFFRPPDTIEPQDHLTSRQSPPPLASVLLARLFRHQLSVALSDWHVGQGLTYVNCKIIRSWGRCFYGRSQLCQTADTEQSLRKSGFVPS